MQRGQKCPLCHFNKYYKPQKGETMKSFREYISEEFEMRPEDKKSFETETGAYHSGARAADYSRLKHLRTPHKYIHSETGENVPFYHSNAVKTANLTPEEREAFHRGYDDQTHHPNHLFGEKDRS